MFPIYSKIFKLPADLISGRFLRNFDDNHYFNTESFNVSQIVSTVKSGDQFLKNQRPDTLVSRNIWQKLINQYWQETVYLSVNNSISDIYTNKLTLNNLTAYNTNEYKTFINKFIKYLLMNHSPVLYSNIYNPSYMYITHNKNIYLKYIWRKKLYLCLNYLNLLSKNSFSSYKGLQNKMGIILYNSLPIFNVINNSHQMIMAESSSKALLNTNTINSQDSQLKYTGLFFIRPEDALEYKMYIDMRYNKSSRNKFTRLSTTSLVNYYKCVYMLQNNVDFRLVPDLNEISKFLHKYQYYKNVTLSHKQEYGKNYFRGQPVYSIQPIKSRHRHLNENRIINYEYLHNKIASKKNIKYNTFFLNYETAILAWKRFREKNTDFHLPTKPILRVSNLEQEINYYMNNMKDIKRQQQKLQNKILVIPSLDTYLFMKNNSVNKLKLNSNSQYNNNLLYMANIMKRILWSLTSRQPISSL